MAPNADLLEVDTPLLPEAFERGLGMPFEGIFGDTVAARVLSEIVADPFSAYSLGELASLTGSSSPSVRNAVTHLLKLGLLTKIPVRARSWVYGVSPGSKRILALTLLTFAILDDRSRSACFDGALHQLMPPAIPNVAAIQVTILNQPTMNIYTGSTASPTGQAIETQGSAIPIDVPVAEEKQ